MSRGRITYQVRYGAPAPTVVSSADHPDVRNALRLHRDTTAGPGHSDSDRAFHLVADGHSGNGSVARVVTEQHLSRVNGRPAVYRVEDPYGTPLGRVTLRRRPLGRTRWTVEPVAGPALRGFKGRMVWWVLWWPFGLPLSLIWAITSLFADEGDGGFRAPRRVTWRDGSGRAHVVYRGMAEEYRVRTDGWDPRLLAALIGLHQSFDPDEAAKRGGWYEY
ncbi:hypothetical protein OHT76_14190 [Streptomyces sp. NBC_00287]|uniref:hypothetical protein n=1 Tax=Streptomyces sp. NBC_00287 TaxID=2975702 RepID=UPI002E2D4DBC|nr:hypothetical protein [Streptomyces sp. NBC_00287]